MAVLTRAHGLSDVETPDGIPIDLLLLILFPSGEEEALLRALAWGARRLRDKEVAARIRSASTRDAIHAVISGDAWRQADSESRSPDRHHALGASSSAEPALIVGTNDNNRLTRIARHLEAEGNPLAPALAGELARARLFDPDMVPPDVVTMNSFVVYSYGDSEKTERRALVYPGEHVWPPAEVSILTPLGVTLLGLRAGDRMELVCQSGDRTRVVRVHRVESRAASGFVSWSRPMRAGAR